jgi:rare lipoprotein A
MNRFTCATVLLTSISLAGCASQTPSPAPPQLPSEGPPPQSSVEQPFFTQTGLASFYGAAQDGKTTADGDTFDQRGLTAAHRTLPFGTVIRVTNTDNGRSVKVSINDRGPQVKDRIIDLSYAAARALGMKDKGVVHVRLEGVHSDQALGLDAATSRSLK